MDEIIKMDVIFRKFKDGEVLAIFPYDAQMEIGIVTCYVHIGQHSSCDYDYMISKSKPAKENEYKDLLMELKEIGYDVNVITRRNIVKYTNKWYDVRNSHLERLQKTITKNE